MRNKIIPASESGAIAPMGIAIALRMGFADGSRSNHSVAPRHMIRENNTNPTLRTREPNRFEEQCVKHHANTFPRIALRIAIINHSRMDELRNEALAASCVKR